MEIINQDITRQQ